jgi:hypothetical protein
MKISLADETLSNIENTTSNFLKLIKASSCVKNDFIGKSMNFLIPHCYVREHMRGMR